MTLALSYCFLLCCEAIMRLFSRIVTIATVRAWMAIHVDPAAAQTFDETGPSFRRHMQSRLPRYPAKLRRTARATSTRRRADTGGKIIEPLDPSPGFFRKGLLLCLQDWKNSERFLVRSENANRGPPQPAVSARGSRHDPATSKSVVIHHRPWNEGSWPRLSTFRSAPRAA